MPCDYLLHKWVVMPNQVHLLLTRQIEPSVALRRLKGVSAREANQVVERLSRAEARSTNCC